MELLRNSIHLLETLVYLLDVRADHVAGFITGKNRAVESLDIVQQVDDAGGGGFVLMDDDTFVTINCTIPRDVSSMNFSSIDTEGKLYLNSDDREWQYWSLEDGDQVERDLTELGIEGAWTWEDDYRHAFASAAEHVQDLSMGRKARREAVARHTVRSGAIEHVAGTGNRLVAVPSVTRARR